MFLQYPHKRTRPMYEDQLISYLKNKLPKRTKARHRLSTDDQSKLFAMVVDTMGMEDRLRLLRTCAMRGYIE